MPTTTKQRKSRLLILVSPRGDLTATYAGSLHRLPEERQKWQILLQIKAVEPMRYLDYAYHRLVSLYGL